MITATLPAATAKISYEEFLEWPGENQHVEWVDGAVVPMSPISNRHQDVGGFLISLLRFYADAHQLGEVRYDPFQMKIGATFPGRAPDILFVATANANRLKSVFLDGPADLVVEIISPESRARDRGDKFYEYEEGGVPEYWLLDPIRDQAEFYQRDPSGIYRSIPLDAEGKYHSVVLPGLWLQASWLWETPLPPLLLVLKQWDLIP